MSSKPLIPFEQIASGHPFFIDTDVYPNWDENFKCQKPLKLEIGFGNGKFLLDMAISDPNSNFLGLDFYHKGIRKTIMKLDRFQIPNVRIIYGDAKERVPVLFKDGELDEIFINFPDPWPKKRHIKRRLIKPDFINVLAQKIAPGGTLKIATDFEPYATEMLSYLEEEPSLLNLNKKSGFSHVRNGIPQTKYEKNFLKIGKSIFYFDFQKHEEYVFSNLVEPAPAG